MTITPLGFDWAGFCSPVMRRGTSRDRELCFASTAKQADRCRSWVIRYRARRSWLPLNVPFARPAQPVDATQALNLSAGVSNCKVSRGRSLIVHQIQHRDPQVSLSEVAAVR